MSTNRRLASALCALALVAAPVAWACGPFFPDRMLIDRSSSLLKAPRARFATDVAALRAKPQGIKPNWTQDLSNEGYHKQTAEADIADLKLALDGKPSADALAQRYGEVRALLASMTAQPSNGASGAKPPALQPPPGVPAEFADYLEGAIAWGRGDHDGARKSWERLLGRPAAERRFRSTWAAFMLGRLEHAGDRSKARRRYQETRSLASQGFRDSLGLAAASLGLEAQLDLDDKNFEKAAQLYLDASTLGDEFGPSSLNVLCWRLHKLDDAALRSALKSAPVRAVLASFLAASDPDENKDLFARFMPALLEVTRGQRDAEGADRLAWATYQKGDLKGAEEWLSRAREDSPISAWIRSKLLARQGKLDDAAKALGGAINAFPLDSSRDPSNVDDDMGRLAPELRLRGELAVLKLARKQYADALDLLLRSGYWRDAALVAERVLTVDELSAYIEKNWPLPASKAAAPAAEGDDLPPMDTAERVRYLLARRLARLGRWSEALPLMPAPLQPRVSLLLAAQKKASNHALPAADRAEALWTMARIERTKGLELMGTEVGPDWAVDGGQFDEDEQVGKPPAKERLALLSEAEKKRIQQSAPAFKHRFHYRYVAAEHALEAARLLPQGSPKIGEMLCTAFGWVKNRNAKAAAKYSREARNLGSPCP